ncbi:MAG: ribonuclease III [Simkaniaceae bacterium]|nr:ribonuclease III [Simkaniaceae bacterium]MCF7852484.1 ribonuclease III [Simkaniaceae bacterium]
MFDLELFENNLALIEEKLNYRFKDIALLRMACIHSSFMNEYRDIDFEHNERIEFLGDAVLGLIVCDELYRLLSTQDEGKLSHLKSQLIEAPACVKYIDKLGIAEFIMTGRGESRNQGKGRQTILADFFEAVIGAIYLDSGFDRAKAFFLEHFCEDIQEAIDHPEENAKVLLQDHMQKLYKQHPEYHLISEEGPGHDKVFIIGVYFQAEELARGEGASKKEAQLAAAKEALKKIKNLSP